MIVLLIIRADLIPVSLIRQHAINFMCLGALSACMAALNKASLGVNQRPESIYGKYVTYSSRNILYGSLAEAGGILNLYL
jgi:hypothetical protein